MARTLQLKSSVGNKTLEVKHHAQGRVRISHPTPQHREKLKRSEFRPVFYLQRALTVSAVRNYFVIGKTWPWGPPS
jgi:hypothetical protein